MMQHHEPECHVEKKLFAIFKLKVTVRAHSIKVWLFPLCLLNCWFFSNQTYSHDTSSLARVSCEKKKDYCIQGQGHSKESKCQCLSRWYLLNRQSFFFTKLGIVMHHHESECHANRLVYYFQGQGHSKGSYDQNMKVSTLIFWIADPYATKLFDTNGSALS